MKEIFKSIKEKLKALWNDKVCLAFSAFVVLVLAVALFSSCQGLVNANGSDNTIQISDSLNLGGSHG